MSARPHRWFGPALLLVSLAGCSAFVVWLYATRGAPVVGAVAAVVFFAVVAGTLIAGVFASLAAARTQQRVRAGLCQGCGYDLRASRQFGRCPECGDAVPPEGSAPDGTEDRGPPEWTPMAQRALARAAIEARNSGRDYVGTEHLLLALMAEAGG